MLNSDAKISDEERKLKLFDGAPVHYCWWFLQLCEDFPTDATSAAVTLYERGCVSLGRGVLAAWNYLHALVLIRTVQLGLTVQYSWANTPPGSQHWAAQLARAQAAIDAAIAAEAAAAAAGARAAIDIEFNFVVPLSRTHDDAASAFQNEPAAITITLNTGTWRNDGELTDAQSKKCNVNPFSLTTANREIVTFIDGRISDRATRKEYGKVAGLDGLLLILHLREKNEKYSDEFGSTAESYLRSHIKKGIAAPTTAAVNSFYSYINIYVSCLPPSRVDPESVQANWLLDAACELGDEIRADARMNVKLNGATGNLSATKEQILLAVGEQESRLIRHTLNGGGKAARALLAKGGNGAADAADAAEEAGFEERVFESIRALEARIDPRRNRKDNKRKEPTSDDKKKFKAAKEKYVAETKRHYGDGTPWKERPWHQGDQLCHCGGEHWIGDHRKSTSAGAGKLAHFDDCDSDEDGGDPFTTFFADSFPDIQFTGKARMARTTRAHDSTDDGDDLEDWSGDDDPMPERIIAATTDGPTLGSESVATTSSAVTQSASWSARWRNRMPPRARPSST